MQALISPNEPVYDYEGNLLGSRVAEVQPETFSVAPPLFWTPCAADVVVDQFYWADGEILPVPPPPAPEPVTPAAPTKEQLLAQLAALQAQIEAVKE
ncbi:hypothetical protein UFOVP732_41 [uncultured Caudovirales phage]|uniref:Uncharacterized protein n=1 Tax=uncultured Caudovirales phage TaxID=2100421 RepID=A0A6J5P185_9CAUD|nr:hypothetical protein UFOVP732_41 [uncultured Caudovirales phage]